MESQIHHFSRATLKVIESNGHQGPQTPLCESSVRRSLLPSLPGLGARCLLLRRLVWDFSISTLLTFSHDGTSALPTGWNLRTRKGGKGRREGWGLEVRRLVWEDEVCSWMTVACDITFSQVPGLEDTVCPQSEAPGECDHADLKGQAQG